MSYSSLKWWLACSDSTLNKSPTKLTVRSNFWRNSQPRAQWEEEDHTHSFLEWFSENTPSRFSILSTLLRARLRYSNCFRRPTFSVERERERERGRERERERERGRERERDQERERERAQTNFQCMQACVPTYFGNEVVLQVEYLQISTPSVQVLNPTILWYSYIYTYDYNFY